MCVWKETATNVLVGFALGYKSTVIPNFALAFNIFVHFSFATMYGISIAIVLIFNTIAFGLVIEAYRPYSDIVIIVKMAEVSHYICERVCEMALKTIKKWCINVGVPPFYNIEKGKKVHYYYDDV